MAKINPDNLEKALSKGANKNAKAPEQQADLMTKEQEIYFHQGSLNTLVNERNELFKMVQNVEAVMQAHLKRLEELGVKIPKQK